MLGNAIALGFTPRASDLILDGNTVAWFDYTKGITLDTGVSVWADQSGNGNDLLQADGAKQPSLELTGVRFDGNDDVMKAAFSYTQPEYIYALMKVISYTSGDNFLDGATLWSAGFYQSTPEPAFRANCGAYSPNYAHGIATGTYVVIRFFVNGASSKLQVNAISPVTGDFGSNNMNGLTLGAKATPLSWANVEFAEVICRNVADSSSIEAAIYDYLDKKKP